MLQLGTLKIPPNEDELVPSRFVAPRAVLAAVQQHVNALKYVTARLVAKTQDSLGAKDIGTLRTEKLTDPLIELVRIEIAAEVYANRGNLFVVLVSIENLELLQLDHSRWSAEHGLKFRETPFRKQHVAAGRIDLYLKR